VAIDRTTLRALSDPLRLRLLNLLGTQTLSAAEAARAIGITQALASYHLRKLLDAGLVVVQHTRSNRGATEKVYELASAQERPLVFASDDLALFLEAVATEIRRRAASADTDAPSLVSDTELWATEEAIDQARTALAGAARALVDGKRPAGTPGTLPVSATTVFFQLKPEASDDVGA
jgi:DNA-binding transcriptional ArsR family regulator